MQSAANSAANAGAGAAKRSSKPVCTYGNGRADHKPDAQELSASEHIYICSFDLTYPSIVLLEQMRTVDKQRISERIGKLSDLTMQRVDAGLRYFLSLSQKEKAGDEWL